MSGAKSPRLQGKIVETGVRFEHPFYFCGVIGDWQLTPDAGRHNIRSSHFVRENNAKSR
jgi:hypothetical protein